MSSNATEDACGVCGGNNSTCRKFERVISRLPAGGKWNTVCNGIGVVGFGYNQSREDVIRSELDFIGIASVLLVVCCVAGNLMYIAYYTCLYGWAQRVEYIYDFTRRVMFYQQKNIYNTLFPPLEYRNLGWPHLSHKSLLKRVRIFTERHF